MGFPRVRSAAWLLAAILVAAPLASADEAEIALGHGVIVRELRPGYWLHTTLGPDGFPANGMAVRLADGVLLVDTGWNDEQADALAAWAVAALAAPVRRAIVTHSHTDRTGGVFALRRRGVSVLALDGTIGRMEGAGGAIQALFAASSSVHVDTEGFEAFYPGAAHAPDNIVVWFPGPRILFGGCMVKAEDAPALGNVADADLPAWPKAIEAVQSRYPKADIVVPGHGPVGGPQALAHTLDLLRPK
jgi:glyoxylase-like metal-dependent hydrolase (beta-lactamase superfamily II)